MNYDEAINDLQRLADGGTNFSKHSQEACRMGLAAVRAQAERENPKPLTMYDKVKFMSNDNLKESLKLLLIVLMMAICAIVVWTNQ